MDCACSALKLSFVEYGATNVEVMDSFLDRDQLSKLKECRIFLSKYMVEREGAEWPSR